MTSNAKFLTNISNYTGADSVTIGNGLSLSITGTGDLCVRNETILPLNDVLLVPKLKKNLMSISQLNSQLPVNCEFFYVSIYVKDRKTVVH